MRHRVREDEYRSNRDIAILILLPAIAMAVVAVIYLPLVLYYAMPLFFVTALLFATHRRRRTKRASEDRRITLEGLF